jgi:hypothetical protein
MTQCTPQLSFSFYSHRFIRCQFSGGQISSDAGLLPLRGFDQRHRLTADLAKVVSDDRDSERIEHSLLTLLRQRLYSICAGYEDANDAHSLRHDPIMQIIADQPVGEALGSQPTLSRLENTVTPRDIVRLTRVLLEWFIRVCGRQVRAHGEILLDLDSTNDPTHGGQQLSMFNGYYGENGYHPLVIFERHTGCLLDVRLRRGNCVSYNRLLGRLRRLLRRLQAAFPGVPIRLRADAGFAWKPLYELLDQMGVEYAIRIKRNPTLYAKAESLIERVQQQFAKTQQPQVSYTSFWYQAGNWEKHRRVLVKGECSGEKAEPWFVLTNLGGAAAETYAFYNGRGECENRIAEFKNGFHADRLSCHRFLANAFRLVLHGLAYNLVNLFRLRLPEPLRRLQISSLRQQFFKVGARIVQSARWLWVHLSSSWPYQANFARVAKAAG